VIQVGKAFGWQLEHLSVRPNYLHWVIAMPPGTSPGYMVRIMRDHASHRIFNQFPGLAQENQTGDFWAAGYLIVNGKYPLSHQLVEDFIGKIRMRQAQSHHHSLTDF
jgi:REP element-mobilizing transposase RayT